jgi:hypothetical protein
VHYALCEGGSSFIVPANHQKLFFSRRGHSIDI